MSWPLIRVRFDDDLHAAAGGPNRLLSALQDFEFQSLHIHPDPIRHPAELVTHGIDGEHLDADLSG